MIIDYLKNIFRAGVTNFLFFLLNILCGILLCLKCLSINFKKYLPTFIFSEENIGTCCYVVISSLNVVGK